MSESWWNGDESMPRVVDVILCGLNISNINKNNTSIFSNIVSGIISFGICFLYFWVIKLL